MPKKLKIPLLALLVLLLSSLSLGSGCSLLNPLASATPAPTDTPNAQLIDEAWGILQKNYVIPSKADSTTLNEGAVRGMVDSLKDPYSAYLNPADYKLTQSDFQGSFSGIGAQVTLDKSNVPIIVAPIEGSPAALAGIKTGDAILAVDGVPTEGLSLTEVVLKIRGPSGTSVKLLIQHSGQAQPTEITIVRAQITSPSVTSQMKTNVAYLQINSFADNTNDAVNQALQSLDLKNAAGIILDLRDNPGGIVTTVVDVASHFIKNGVIITLRDNQGKTQAESAHPNGVFTELPMVVLVNQYSASGSEVLSGALQDYKRATIAGTVTLGKGSYDSLFPLSDGSAIYLTIGRWITPNGREIEGKGITPDITLTQTGDDAIIWAVDFLNGRVKQ